MSTETNPTIDIGEILRKVLFVVCLAAAPSALFGWRHNGGYQCTICGASKSQITFSLGSMEVCWRRSIQPNVVSRMRTKFIGPCTHDWTPSCVTSTSMFRSGETGCCFPNRHYPIGKLPDKLAAGLRGFKDREAMVQALKVIGDKDNWLRFLAAESVMSLSEKNATFDWDAWWSSHSTFFSVCRDPQTARRIAETYVDSEDGLISLGAQETIMELQWLAYYPSISPGPTSR